MHADLRRRHAVQRIDGLQRLTGQRACLVDVGIRSNGDLGFHDTLFMGIDDDFADHFFVGNANDLAVFANKDRRRQRDFFDHTGDVLHGYCVAHHEGSAKDN